MPKLSPESDGAQRTSAACSSAHSSSSETRPRMSIELSSSGSGSQRLTSSSPAPLPGSPGGPCPPPEEYPHLPPRRLRPDRRSIDVDAFGDDRVLAAEPALPGPGGRLGDR